VFTGFAAAIVGSRLLLGRVPDRIGARRCAVIAGLAEAAGLAVIALSSSLAVALPAAIAMGVGFALLYPALAMVVVERVPEERRGAALGTFTACFDIGFGVGGPLAGGLAALGGYALAFWAAVAAGLGTALIAARVTSPRSAPTPARSSPA